MKPRSPQPQRRIFIGNVSYKATESELAKALENIGVHVFRVCIVVEKETGKSRGFAFVDIDRDDPKSVEEIIELVNRRDAAVMLYGRRLRADKANERTPAKPRGGRGKVHNELTASPNEFADDGDFTW